MSENKEKYLNNIIYFYGMIKNNSINLMDLYKEIKDNKLKYNSIVYNKEKENILYEVNLLKEPIKIVEGIYKCDKCGDKKLIIIVYRLEEQMNLLLFIFIVQIKIVNLLKE